VNPAAQRLREIFIDSLENVEGTPIPEKSASPEQS